jgi:dipeptidyl aminopeptidase/acylaminoacyl peptidase
LVVAVVSVTVLTASLVACGGGVPSWVHWDDSCPAWSPDGKRIAFASTRADYGHPISWYRKRGDYIVFKYDLYVMAADGGHVRRLTHLIGGKAGSYHDLSVDEAAPVWSADGRLIFFTVTSPADQAGDAEGGAPTSRRGLPYAVNSTGKPTLRRATLSDFDGRPHYPEYDYDRQDECAAHSPNSGTIAFYRPVDTGVGAGGFGVSGIICVKTIQGKEETLTQGLGKSCPNTT